MGRVSRWEVELVTAAAEQRRRRSDRFRLVAAIDPVEGVAATLGRQPDRELEVYVATVLDVARDARARDPLRLVLKNWASCVAGWDADLPNESAFELLWTWTNRVVAWDDETST